MVVDKSYCMNSFLMYRRIVDTNYCFSENILPNFPDMNFKKIGVSNSDELYVELKKQVEDACKDGKAALALSGGIDSAILAALMPKGSVAYTFKCIVPGVEVVDESKLASKYAEKYGLEHRIIEIYWEDYEIFSPALMKRKGAPIHSIEVQIYKLALQAKKDGFKRLIYGESADCIFGGHSKLLSRDWLVGDFIERYSFVKPHKVLKNAQWVLDPIRAHEKDGYIDPHEFLSTEYFPESIGSYINASETANMDVVMPYANCYMACPIDYKRIRAGENKYLVREVFKTLYKDFEIPEKLPMPRATNEWFMDWEGPIRPEFNPHCIEGMTGDEKWLVYILEKFLNMIENEIDSKGK